MLKNFKYIHNISEGTAEIRIYKRIGAEFGNDGINGADFANEMAYLAQYAKKINVRINSGGGNVIESYAIISSILNSPVPCDTYIDGIAASAAASIAVAGRKCYMVDYGVFMIHNASDAKGKGDKAILDLFNASINTILTNRCGKTSDEISSMMSKETWMNAKECMDHKMVDEIISTEKKMKVTATTPDEYYAVFNELLTNKPNMKNLTAMLGLTNEANEAEIVKAIEAKDAKIADLSNKITAFEAEKNEAIEAAKTALIAKATTLVNKAVADKKITEEEKANVLTNASSSESAYELVSSMLDKISNVKEPNRIFDASKVTNAVGGVEDRSSWTIRDWEVKDSKGLAELQANSPFIYEQMFNAYYKTNK